MIIKMNNTLERISVSKGTTVHNLCIMRAKHMVLIVRHVKNDPS